MKIVLHTNKQEDVDSALDVSKKVFEPSKEELLKYHDKTDWLNKINSGGLLVTAWDDKNIVGFSICYPKEKILHIWNVGVIKDYRKHGIWKMMYEEIEKFANKKKFDQLTLNTYKDKFPSMYNFVLNNGYTVYKTEEDKSFCIKEI